MQELYEFISKVCVRARAGEFNVYDVAQPIQFPIVCNVAGTLHEKSPRECQKLMLSKYCYYYNCNCSCVVSRERAAMTSQESREIASAQKKGIERKRVEFMLNFKSHSIGNNSLNFVRPVRAAERVERAT